MDDVDTELAAAVTLPEFKQLLSRLSAKLSLRELESTAKSAGYKLSKSAASQARNPEDPRVPENRTVRAMVRGCGGSEEEADEWMRTLIRVTRERNSRVPAEGTQIDLSALVRYYDGQTRLPEAILRGNLEKTPNLAAMASAVDFLVTLMPVTARTAAQHHAVRLDGAPGLLALMACDMVLYRRDEASQKWLVKETSKILNDDKDAEKEQLRRVWSMLFTVYARDTWPIEDILDKVVERVPGQPGRFYSIVCFLLDLPALRDDAEMVARLHRRLLSHENALPEDASLEWRRRVKHLLGATAPSPGEGFSPNLTPIKAGPLCDYDFEAMTHPLTVWEVDGLFQTRTDRPTTLFHPYVFDLSGSPSPVPLEVVLADLIGRCQAKAPHDGWVWAVPTAAEWLALAGCQEGTDHPWGGEKIGPHHANLRTGGRPRLEPVGIRPAGRSVTRTWDCLGNVHELVAWNENDYRLAGGCMRNAPSQVDARRFRPLLDKKLRRKNVGIRLIRYRVEDAERRMAVLHAYCASYPSVWRAATASP